MQSLLAHALTRLCVQELLRPGFVRVNLHFALPEGALF
jgi:hypothetical protein